MVDWVRTWRSKLDTSVVEGIPGRGVASTKLLEEEPGVFREQGEGQCGHRW